MNHVVKRKRHKEHYDKKKVYASIYAAALNCHYEDEDAEKLADKITKEVTKWIKDKVIVESKEIKQFVHERLHDRDVAMMYKEHLHIC